MISKIIKDVINFTPLIVDYIEWNDPILSFGGNNWSFYSVSSWRAILNNKLDFACYDDVTEEKLKRLQNNHIISIEIQSNHLPSDPVFVFSNGYKLEIFSVTYLEPWVFGSPTTIVHIGSPSDSRYM